MPKDRRVPRVSFDRSRASPYFSTTKNLEEYKSKQPVGSDEDMKEWEEARCPICMEHPHNAVLLLCSSHEKGCRPYMCNTSYRHSNCLDQFCKSMDTTQSTFFPQEINTSSSTMFSRWHEENSFPHMLPREAPHRENHFQSSIHCPLCRGQISGWVVVEVARTYMNSKQRCCSNETCEFVGAYSELRKHARHNHPYVRPSDVDPTRERDWRRLEHEANYQDILSMAQPAYLDGWFGGSFFPSAFEYLVDPDDFSFESSGSESIEPLGSVDLMVREAMVPLQLEFLVTMVDTLFNMRHDDTDLSLRERGQLQNRRSNRIGGRINSASERVPRVNYASGRRNHELFQREQGSRRQQPREQGSHRQQLMEQGSHRQQLWEQGSRQEQPWEQGSRRQQPWEQGSRRQQPMEQGSRRQQPRVQGSRRLQLREQISPRQQPRWNDFSRRS